MTTTKAPQFPWLSFFVGMLLSMMVGQWWLIHKMRNCDLYAQADGFKGAVVRGRACIRFGPQRVWPETADAAEQDDPPAQLDYVP